MNVSTVARDEPGHRARERIGIYCKKQQDGYGQFGCPYTLHSINKFLCISKFEQQQIVRFRVLVLNHGLMSL